MCHPMYNTGLEGMPSLRECAAGRFKMPGPGVYPGYGGGANAGFIRDSVNAKGYPTPGRGVSGVDAPSTGLRHPFRVHISVESFEPAEEQTCYTVRAAGGQYGRMPVKVPIEISEHATVEELQDKIQEDILMGKLRIQLPADWGLEWGMAVLDPSATFSQLAVPRESNLRVVDLVGPQLPRPVVVTIRYKSNKVVTATVKDPGCTVKDLKEQIHLTELRSAQLGQRSGPRMWGVHGAPGGRSADGGLGNMKLILLEKNQNVGIVLEDARTVESYSLDHPDISVFRSAYSTDAGYNVSSGWIQTQTPSTYNNEYPARGGSTRHPETANWGRVTAIAAAKA